MKTTRLFILDDHYMVIEGFSVLLQSDNSVEIIGHAKDAQSCMSFLQRAQPDVIFLDINLPDTSGIEVCKQIKQLYPAIKIIALSTFNQNSYIQKMLENGASGYLLKNTTKEEILIAIKTVMSHKQYLAREVKDSLKEKAENGPALTRREKEILKLIADGLTSAEIGRLLFISTTTVDTHRKHLLEKFKVNNAAMLIRTAAQQGII